MAAHVKNQPAVMDCAHRVLFQPMGQMRPARLNVGKLRERLRTDRQEED